MHYCYRRVFSPEDGEQLKAELDSGHLFIAASALDRPRAVNVVLHSRWSHAYIGHGQDSGRVLFVDVDLDGFLVRLVSRSSKPPRHSLLQ